MILTKALFYCIYLNELLNTDLKLVQGWADNLVQLFSGGSGKEISRSRNDEDKTRIKQN